VVDCETGDSFSTLVKPGFSRVPPRITEITQIDNRMISAPHVPGFALAAERMELQIAAWAERRKGDPILIAAHNASFDVSFLRAEYDRARRPVPSEWRYVCSLDLAKSLLPGIKSRKLADLNSHFSLAQHTAHRAEGDAHMLRNLLGSTGFGSLEPDLYARLLREAKAFAAPGAAATGPARRKPSATALAAEPLVAETLQSLLEEADQRDDDDWESDVEI